VQPEGREECIEVCAQGCAGVDMWNYFVLLKMEADALLDYFRGMLFFTGMDVGSCLESELRIYTFAGLPIEQGKNALYAPNNIESPGVTIAPRVDRCFDTDRFNIVLL